MEIKEQHISLSSFELKDSVKNMKGRGHKFAWGATQPNDSVRYYELQEGHRICFQNAKLKVYLLTDKDELCL